MFGANGRRLAGRDYVHPDSGREFKVGDRLLVERFLELAPGFPVSASIGFDDDTGVEEVSIHTDLPDENDARDALADALTTFLQQLGLEPPEPADEEDEEGAGEQHWDVPGLEIELVFDADRFELTFSRERLLAPPA